jgi:hypothetical protein
LRPFVVSLNDTGGNPSGLHGKQRGRRVAARRTGVGGGAGWS